MELIHTLIDFILHLDKHLAAMVTEYGTLTYAILFLIVFVETGFIIMPLLPGDSLLFAAGALAASTGALDIKIIIPLLIVAALLGDNLNYFVGKYFSKFVKSRERILFFKREYIEQTESFYAKHGGKTVIMARFIPIVRTIAPFVAGAGSMKYGTYIIYCITTLGYLLGSNPFVKQNFELVVFGIIGFSVLPMVFGFLKAKFAKS